MSRAEQAARRVELAEGAARAEAKQAQVLIDRFVADAREAGPAPVPLKASLYSGHVVRTDKVGWYIRKNKSLAVGDDGAYYVLTVPGGLAERLRGVKLSPSPPPMVIGRGGRDGETGDLVDFLARALQGLT